MNTKNTNRLLPIIKKNRYYNHINDQPENFWLQTIPSFIASFPGRKKRLPENKLEWISCDQPLSSSIEPVVTWIGHASFLIQIAGVNIITDPIFGDISAFFPRILPPGIAAAQLPSIDLVLLSHNHRDHCDTKSLQALQQLHPHITILVPKGDKYWLEKRGFTVVEHNWWDHYTFMNNGQSVTLSFLPAHHWSAHGIFDRNKSLWGSWMIGYQDTKIYFAGDTAYSEHFKHIADEFSTITMALMPIAPGEPEPWMRKSHMDAQQAVQAFIDLQATHFIPMHWGTFQFGRDTFSGPLDRLNHTWALREMDRKNKKLTIAKIGQRVLV